MSRAWNVTCRRIYITYHTFNIYIWYIIFKISRAWNVTRRRHILLYLRYIGYISVCVCVCVTRLCVCVCVCDGPGGSTCPYQSTWHPSQWCACACAPRQAALTYTAHPHHLPRGSETATRRCYGRWRAALWCAPGGHRRYSIFCVSICTFFFTSRASKLSVLRQPLVGVGVNE